MRKRTLLFSIATAMLVLPAVGASAHERDYRSQHLRDHAAHARFHDYTAWRHRHAHEHGFWSRGEHRAYHHALGHRHEHFHDNHPQTRHDHWW